jgi:hypothetical protein
MKKLILLPFFALTLAIASCGTKAPQPASDSVMKKLPDSTATATAYVCPMGDQCGNGNAPGKCPNCGMEFIKRK